MTIWETLGIGPTSDLRAIQSAYARRVRDCHPEEKPEAFQQLYEAYQSAVRLARADLRKAPKAPASLSAQADELELDFQVLIRKGLAQTEHRRVGTALARLKTAVEKEDCQLLSVFLTSPDFNAVKDTPEFLDGTCTFLQSKKSLPGFVAQNLLDAYGMGAEQTTFEDPRKGWLYRLLVPWRPEAALQKGNAGRRQWANRFTTVALFLFCLFCVLISFWSVLFPLGALAVLVLYPHYQRGVRSLRLFYAGVRVRSVLITCAALVVLFLAALVFLLWHERAAATTILASLFCCMFGVLLALEFVLDCSIDWSEQ